MQGDPETVASFKFLIVFVATVIIVDGLVGDRGLLAMLRARQEYDQLAETIARLRAENARLARGSPPPDNGSRCD